MFAGNVQRFSSNHGKSFQGRLDFLKISAFVLFDPWKASRSFRQFDSKCDFLKSNYSQNCSIILFIFDINLQVYKRQNFKELDFRDKFFAPRAEGHKVARK